MGTSNVTFALDFVVRKLAWSQMASIAKITHQTTVEILSCDPYLASRQLFTPLKSAKILPNLTFPDTYMYLVHNLSTYTRESL